MDAVHALRNEHETLRQQLDLLELELRHSSELGRPIQELCHSIRRLLDAHVREEEPVVSPYTHRIVRALRQRVDHADEQALLSGVDATLSAHIELPASVIVQRLDRAMGALRTHMAIEEREVFPVVEQAEAERSGDRAAGEPHVPGDGDGR